LIGSRDCISPSQQERRLPWIKTIHGLLQLIQYGSVLLLVNTERRPYENVLRTGKGQDQMIIKPSELSHTRSTISRLAHVLERIGLALVGATCGLFVAEVSRLIHPVDSIEVVAAITIYGATGYYLGIDLPQPPSCDRTLPPLSQRLRTSADMVELLSAAGTFLTSGAAMVSVSSIVLGEFVGHSTGSIIFLSWIIGATMQTVAGIVLRIKLSRAIKSAKLALFFR
jgi:hypothetical protein